MTDAPAQLSGLVDVWWEAVNDFTALLEKVPEDAWHTPTDLAGWDIHAVAAHVAHLESLLAGNDHDDVEVGDAPHAHGMMGKFTEQGVVARRDRTPDELINEIRACTTARHTQLLAEPPADPAAPAPGLFGAIGWNTLTLLKNRPLDVWMHDQDVRRALGLAGGLDTPAAGHSAAYLADSLGYVLAKKVKADPGTTVLLEVAGQPTVAAGVNEEGRGQLLAEAPSEPTVTIRTDRESFIVLGGGRRRPDQDRIEVVGDIDLGRRVLDALAVTP